MAVWLRETRYIGLTTIAPRVGPFWTVSLSKTFRVLAFYCASFLDVHRASLQPASCHHYWEHCYPKARQWPSSTIGELCTQVVMLVAVVVANSM